MPVLLDLFLTFLKIGAVSFGGGYAMIPMVTEEVVAKGWLTSERVMDFIAVAESTPGPIAINMATFIGAAKGGFWGAILATAGVVLPAFIIILIVALFFIPSFAKQQELPYVALVGTMNDWESNANPFIPAEDGQTASLTLNMVSDGYIHLFKILVGSNELTVHGNYFEFSRNNNSAILNDADPNSEVLALILDATGDYTFTWRYADSLLTITYPEKVKFYITGNAALVGEELEWNPAAIKSVEDSYTFHLAAGDYESDAGWYMGRSG